MTNNSLYEKPIIIYNICLIPSFPIKPLSILSRGSRFVFLIQNLTMILLSWGPLSIIIHSKNVLTLFQSPTLTSSIFFVNCGITTYFSSYSLIFLPILSPLFRFGSAKVTDVFLFANFSFKILEVFFLSRFSSTSSPSRRKGFQK